jgi:hypothetical protein
MNEERDWRLDTAQGPEFYSKYSWQFKPWTQTRDHWDHDHCEFCWTEISAISGEDILNEGWTNEDEYYWICDKCFKDFKELFKWNIKA